MPPILPPILQLYETLIDICIQTTFFLFTAPPPLSPSQQMTAMQTVTDIIHTHVQTCRAF